jgi:hypothetical protein
MDRLGNFSEAKQADALDGHINLLGGLYGRGGAGRKYPAANSGPNGGQAAPVTSDTSCSPVVSDERTVAATVPARITQT